MRFLPLSAVLLMASACTVGPDYARPTPAVAPNWVERGLPGPVDTIWWHQFNDPVLTGLVERALKDAPDLRQATARLAEARANRDAAAGGRAPSVSATGSATCNRLSENGQLPIADIPGFERDFSLFDLGFDASWELDLWGRKTREVEGARARVGGGRSGARRRDRRPDRGGRAQLCRPAAGTGGRRDAEGGRRRRCGPRAADRPAGRGGRCLAARPGKRRGGRARECR